MDVVRALARAGRAAVRAAGARALHVSAAAGAWSRPAHSTTWPAHNRTVFPPQAPGEPPRPAYVCVQKTNIRYSPDKMWYVASLVRGMSVDEAIKQLSFVSKKGSAFVKEAIMEAQDLAVKEHNVEFRSNLWVAESHASKGTVIKGVRRHARGRIGEVRYTHCHYFVRLEEGKPPKDYYKRDLPTPQQQLEDWLEQMRKRKITNSY